MASAAGDAGTAAAAPTGACHRLDAADGAVDATVAPRQEAPPRPPQPWTPAPRQAPTGDSSAARGVAAATRRAEEGAL